MGRNLFAQGCGLALGLIVPHAVRAQLPAGSLPDSAAAAALGLTPGARVGYVVRHEPARLRTDRLLRVEHDTLWLAESRVVALHDLGRLYISAGRASIGARIGRGAFLGAVLGGAFGALPDADAGANEEASSRAAGAAVGALVGLAVGGLGGALLRGEAWREIRPVRRAPPAEGLSKRDDG